MERQIYFGDWEDSGFLGMVEDFLGGHWYRFDEDGEEIEINAEEEAKKPMWQGLEILFAAYTYENYHGEAFVLFKRDGQLYEVNGGHCSCYGLGDDNISGGSTQWKPEETTAEAIKARFRADPFDDWEEPRLIDAFRDEITAALEAA